MKKLVTYFKKFAEAKNIDHPTFIQTLDKALRAAIEAEFGTSENFHIVINPNGDLQILRYKEIVDNDSEHAYDDDKITLSEAQKVAPDFNVGEELGEEIDFTTFGRRAISKGGNLLKESILHLEQESIFKRYKAYQGELIYAEVYYMTPSFVILHDTEKNELFLPKENQIPGERYKKGAHIHAIVQDVTIHRNRLKVTLTRTSNSFLEKTLETQIDEIAEGIVKIRKVARRVGQKAKVIVSTDDDRVDPVGACIGTAGQRIKNISRRELWNEQVDIIGYTDNEEMLLKKSLAPAQLHRVQIEEDRITVYLNSDQVALAIGAGGQNIELASQLLGKPIDVYKEFTPGQPIPLDEFTEELTLDVIQQLKPLEITTLDQVMDTPQATLKEKTDLTEKEIDHLYHLASKYTIHNPNNHQPDQ